MSDYTPDDIRLAFAESFTLHRMEEPGLTQAYEVFDEFVASVKADALRGAAKATRSEAPGEPHAGATFDAHARWLDERADRIEEAEQ